MRVMREKKKKDKYLIRTYFFLIVEFFNKESIPLMHYCLLFVCLFVSESFFYKTEYLTTSYFMGFGMMLYQLTELPKCVF